MKLKEVKIFEAFAGVGAQYKALKNIAMLKNWNVRSVGIIEWFLPAIIAYQSIHYKNDNLIKKTFLDDVNISFDSKKRANEKQVKLKLNNSYYGYWVWKSKYEANNLFDISSVNYIDIPKDIDIFTYSFPCQDISNQGKQKGFSKTSNTRSGLLWEIERLLKEIKINNESNLPKYLLMENVKAIINNKNKFTLNLWLQELSNIGYDSKIYLLNSSHFGSPQNRERVFVLSILKEYKQKTNFKFETLNNNHKLVPIKSIIDRDNDSYIPTLNNYKQKEYGVNKNNIHKYELLDYTKFHSENYIYDINYSGPTLTASGALSRIKLLINGKIREMSPIECFRYMGFSDEDFEKVVKTNLLNKNKLIYLMGNSINVQVLESIFKSLVFINE